MQNQLLRDATTNYIRAHSNYVRILNLCYVEPDMLEFAERWLKSASEQYRLAEQVANRDNAKDMG